MRRLNFSNFGVVGKIRNKLKRLGYIAIYLDNEVDVDYDNILPMESSVGYIICVSAETDSIDEGAIIVNKSLFGFHDNDQDMVSVNDVDQFVQELSTIKYDILDALDAYTRQHCYRIRSDTIEYDKNLSKLSESKTIFDGYAVDNSDKVDEMMDISTLELMNMRKELS